MARDLGAEIIIAVDLCELLGTTFPSNLFGIAKRSAEIAFLWQNQTCTSDADIIIRPKMCSVGTFNDKMKWQLYEAGKTAANLAIPRIQELIANQKECNRMTTEMKKVILSCYGADDYIKGKEF